MVTTFVRLKLTLLKNNARHPRNGVAMVMAAMLALALVGLAWGAVWRLRGSPDWAAPSLIVACATIWVAWVVVPLLVGFTDGTIDPVRLAHLPITPSQMVRGLLAGGSVGIMPVASMAASFSVVMLAPTVGSAVVILVLALCLVGLGVLGSQLASAVLSALVKGRAGRDVAVLVLALMSTLAAIAIQFALQLAPTLQLGQLEAAARLVRWTPGGWLGWGLARSAQGDLGPGLLAGGLSVTLGLGLLKLWTLLLKRILSQAESRVPPNRARRRCRTQWSEARPARLIRGSATAAVMTRTLLTLGRDPRALMALAGQVPLLFVLTLPAWPVLASRDPFGVLAAGSVGFYGGMLNANLFGFDGRGVWLDLLGAPSIRPVLWGKTMAHAVVAAPVMILAVLGLSLWTGGWHLAIPSIGLALGWYGAIAGSHALFSVVAPLALPEGNTPWAGNGSGAGMVNAIVVMAAILTGLILAAPSAILIGASALWNPTVALAVTPIGAAWGVVVWRVGISLATRRVDPEPWLLSGPLTQRH